MAVKKHLELAAAGLEAWSEWRAAHPKVRPDLSDADLSGLDLGGFDLRSADLSVTNLSEVPMDGCDLTRAKLYWSNLEGADLAGADLTEAVLYEADLDGQDLRSTVLDDAVLDDANLRGAHFDGLELTGTGFVNADLEGAVFREAALTEVDFTRANLTRTDFTDADVSGCKLDRATLIETTFSKANLAECSVYGVSVWDVEVTDADQNGLLLAPPGDRATLSVDNLEVAQFIYLLLTNTKLRDVIDTITSKVVLILGRFTPERKPVLDAVRDQLRLHNYTPVMFDFKKPTSLDLAETVSLLAHMARFVIADLTAARSLPAELQMIVPQLPSVPIAPILEDGTTEYALFAHIARYPSVLDITRYPAGKVPSAALVRALVASAETLRAQ